MSSFYGPGRAGGGGGGTSNYNDLSNTPIKNLSGSDTFPIVLTDLAAGTYHASGTTKVKSDDTTSELLTEQLITVLYDVETGTKVIKYEYLNDNGEPIIRVITAKADGSVVDNPDWKPEVEAYVVWEEY